MPRTSPRPRAGPVDSFSTSKSGSVMAPPPTPSWAKHASPPSTIKLSLTAQLSSGVHTSDRCPPTTFAAWLLQFPEGTHEWVSFPDPDEDRTWVFDVTFLESNWTCIYGQGCQGVLTGPAHELVQGCCSYGAHFTGKTDVKRVDRRGRDPDRRAVAVQSKALPRGSSGACAHHQDLRKTAPSMTRTVSGACIFLNRPGFPGGPGCALHRAALDRGQAPLKLKPDVCWQLPLRREDTTSDDGWVTSTIRQWDRRDWGEGGYEFHWWCTESPDAFVGERPVYKELQAPSSRRWSGKAIFKLADYLSARSPAKRRGRGNPGHRGCEAPGPAGHCAQATRDGSAVSVSGWTQSLASGSSSPTVEVLRTVDAPEHLLELVRLASHHEACSSSGPAPHSGQRRLPPSTALFRLRASSNLR